MVSRAYWKERAALRMAGYHRDSQQTMRMISEAYRRANDTILADMERIYS